MNRPPELPLFPFRPADAHKGSVGSVLVIAGSVGLSGAAYLCAKAALRTGAGVVVTACPAPIQPVLATKHTCVMVRPFPATAAGALDAAAFPDLLELAKGFDAVALGPGLSQDPSSLALARRLAVELTGPRVIDADGLNALAAEPELLKRLGERAVLTPHPGEAARLLGSGARNVQADRRASAASLAALTPATVLLKGQGTLVAQGARAPYVNPSGNPGMATAGAGDVLAGVIAALLAAGLAGFEAASLGAWLHGRAGDLVAARVGMAPLIATDILEGMTAAIREDEQAARGSS